MKHFRHTPFWSAGSEFFKRPPGTTPIGPADTDTAGCDGFQLANGNESVVDHDASIGKDGFEGFAKGGILDNIGRIGIGKIVFEASIAVLEIIPRPIPLRVTGVEAEFGQEPDEKCRPGPAGSGDDDLCAGAFMSVNIAAKLSRHRRQAHFTTSERMTPPSMKGYGARRIFMRQIMNLHE